MIIHKNLVLFLDIINYNDSKLSPIKEIDLKKRFKHNEYYNLKKFCIDNKLIIINYHIITLTSLGNNLFKNLKELTSL
jgi:hypothetical protein